MNKNCVFKGNFFYILCQFTRFAPCNPSLTFLGEQEVRFIHLDNALKLVKVELLESAQKLMPPIKQGHMRYPNDLGRHALRISFEHALNKSNPFFVLSGSVNSGISRVDKDLKQALLLYRCRPCDLPYRTICWLVQCGHTNPSENRVSRISSRSRPPTE